MADIITRLGVRVVTWLGTGYLVMVHTIIMRGKAFTHNMANFLGLIERIGNSAKQITKQARAAKLQPPKMIILSHVDSTSRVRCQFMQVILERTPTVPADYSPNQPSSSSLLFGAGSGAPGAACVGNWTPPPLPKGLYEDNLPSIGVEELVFAGMSGSRLDHPSEFMLSRNDVDAITTSQY